MHIMDLLTFYIISLIIVFIGIVCLKRELSFKKNARIIEGKIIKVHAVFDYIYPTIEYFDPITNSTHSWKSEISLLFKRKNSKVKIRVLTTEDKRRDERVLFTHIHSFAIFTIAIFMFLFGTWMMLLSGIDNSEFGFLILFCFPFLVLVFLFYLHESVKIF